MSKKLTGNGLWESSRMMLPEHKETIVQRNKRLTVKRMPILDEQEWEQINEGLSQAYEERQEISIVIFGEWENQVVTGVITKFDRDRLMIAGQWVKAREIVDVRS